MHWTWAFWHFLSKNGRQKYSASVPWDPFMHMRIKLEEWNNIHPVYQFLKFLSDCRFNFKAYAKNVREKTTKSWHKFDIYQSTVAPNCFKSHTNSWCLDFFQIKNVFLISDMKSILSDKISFSPGNLSEYSPGNFDIVTK